MTDNKTKDDNILTGLFHAIDCTHHLDWVNKHYEYKIALYDIRLLLNNAIKNIKNNENLPKLLNSRK